jgi:rhomboid family GlyGly-CTERM serine protease
MNRSSCLTVNAAGRLRGASLLFVAFAIAVSLLPGVAVWLQYDRSALANGALWRIVTSHFVHWSAEHLFWDALALAVLGWLCERHDVGRFLACVAASSVLIPLTLCIAEPQLTTYRGLSGIDSALFAMLAARIISEAIADKDWCRLKMAVFFAAGFAAKVGYELLTGGTLFVDSTAAGMTPVPLAHVVGGLVGLACGLCARASEPPALSRRDHIPNVQRSIQPFGTDWTLKAGTPARRRRRGRHLRYAFGRRRPTRVANTRGHAAGDATRRRLDRECNAAD